MTILYICDGNEECRGGISCHYTEGKNGPCRRTVNEERAKYGPCDGNPEWYPERFYSMTIQGENWWIEKERY